MDGTLFDTEKYYNRAWKKAISDSGYELPEEEVLKLRSLGRPFALEQFQRWFGPEVDYLAIREHRKELMKDFLSGQIPLKPEVPETLRFLKAQGYRLAVVTATGPEQAEHNLCTAGIRQYFDAVICATMVERGKTCAGCLCICLSYTWRNTGGMLCRRRFTKRSPLCT
mgnify:CR=1 FL=1